MLVYFYCFTGGPAFLNSQVTQTPNLNLASITIYIKFLFILYCLPLSLSLSLLFSLIVTQVLIDLSNTSQLDNTPRWLPLKEQSESIEHSRAHHAAQGPSGSGSSQGHGQGQGHISGSAQGHGMGQGLAPGQGDGSHDSPKNSVIKSRSHGIFPDPAKGKESPHSYS